MDLQFLLLFLALALLAEVIGTVGGFGSSLFFVPMAEYFFDFHTVLGITAFFHVASNVSKIALFRKGVDKTLILQLGVPAVVCVIAGAWLSQWVEGRWLELVLAAFLISLSLFLLLTKHVVIAPTRTNSFLGGSLSGLLAGLVGTGGAVRGATLAAFQLKKDVFIATSAIIDLGVDVSRSAVYAWQGYMQKEHLYLVAALVGVSVVGTWIGKQLLHRFSERQFRTAVLLLVLATGVYTLGQAWLK